MQCPDCGYISFKLEKSCGSCGFNFKKAAVSNSSLFRNDSFTIFSSPKASEEEKESIRTSTPQAEEGIAVLESPEGTQENPELESGEFLLNLSDAKQDQPETDLKSETSKSSTSSFTPMEFGTDSEINLEEMEVEGLGLGLEPLEEEPPTTEETSKSEDIQLEISEEPVPSNLDLTPDNSDNIELNIDESGNNPSSEQEISESLPEEITLNIGDLDDTVESIELKESNDELEIVTPSPQDTEQSPTEPEAPVLDLGDTEISLDFDEDSKPKSPDTPPAPPLDDLEIKLEIDDSDGPLIINDDAIPEVEIEDLGLELEESDPPPDPEKP